MILRIPVGFILDLIHISIGQYFNFDCPPKYYFETNANRLDPVLISESEMTLIDFENILSLFYTFEESESIVESIDNGYPCMFNIEVDNNKNTYTICVGYTTNGRAIYFNPYINKLETREIDALDSGVLYSITGRK